MNIFELEEYMEKEQAKLREVEQPLDWEFEVIYTEGEYLIFWGYLDNLAAEDEEADPCRVYNVDGFWAVRNNFGELINGDLIDTSTLKAALKSLVYYLNTRY